MLAGNAALLSELFVTGVLASADPAFFCRGFSQGGWGVNPAAVMGTFLRTWRAEWTGLSRAQLAIAVNAKRRSGRRLSEDRMRRWEEGQPPKSTAELEALCEVMGERGLFPLEIKQFQQAVFAACADRQFPELFTNAEWVYRDDVDAWARRVVGWERLYRTPANIVDLVAGVEELSRVVESDQRPRPSPAQRQRQRTALVYLRGALVAKAGGRGRQRSAYVAQLCLQQAALLEAHFSGSSVTREWEVDEWRMYHHANSAPTRGPRSVQALFDLAVDAEERINREYAAWVFCCALGRLEHGTQAQRDYAWRAAPEHAVVAMDQEHGPHFHCILSGWGLRMGHVAEAERLLEPFQIWRNDSDPVFRRRWAGRMAHWARVTEDYHAELGYLEKELAYCRRAGHPDEGVLARIARCELACQAASRRRKRGDTAGNGKANRSASKRSR